MALPKKGIYPHAVHFIPKDFLETLQMKGLACSRGGPQGPKRFLWRKTAMAEDTRGCSDSGPLFCWRAVIAALLADKAV